MRWFLLKTSQNRWLRRHATHYGFMRRTVARFMPGETLVDALATCSDLAEKNMKTVLTHLGENISERSEAEAVTNHYLHALGQVESSQVSAEISVKLTQLGLDLDPSFCFSNLSKLAEHCSEEKTVWIDMEQSAYVDATLEFYKHVRHAHGNVGVCVQAYLKRTERDLDALIRMGATVRLVKGAYNEPQAIAIRNKKAVDQNYFTLAQKLLGSEARRNGVRTAFATHDRELIERITDWATVQSFPKHKLEFQMLYGIQSGEQLRLAREGYDSRVLVAYGSFWFPWFMRRLAERPANVMLVAKNLF